MDIWDWLYPRDERRQRLVKIVGWLLTVAAGVLLALTPFIREGAFPPFGQRWPGQHLPETTAGKLVAGVGVLVLVIVLGWVWNPARRGGDSRK